MPSPEVFPIIDLSQTEDWPNVLGDAIVEACKNWGFMILTGHGIPQANIDRMFELHKAFCAQPMEVKTEKMLDPGRQIGFDQKRSKISTADAMLFGGPKNASLQSLNIPSWWDPQKLREVEAFKSQAHALSISLIRVFAKAFGLPPDYFTTAHNEEVGPGSVLRMIHYPKLESQPGDDISRCYAHTDWGSMTLLWMQSPGLEVETPSKSWVEVPMIPCAVVVNIGDAMSLWSGQTLKSTLHKVEWDKVPIHQDRWSMAYFFNANTDAKLEVLQHDGHGKLKSGNDMPSMTMGEYHQARAYMIHHESAKNSKIGQDDACPAAMQKYARMIERLGVANGSGVVDVAANA